MPRDTSEAEHDTGMLNRIISIIEQRAGDSDLRSLTRSEQLPHTIPVNHFRIIVQKQQVIPLCMCRTEIVDRRKIEAALVTEHTDPRILPTSPAPCCCSQ